jgi:GH25 family lysozyme M1 (1,4-beta-N-acetylmuramidase)
MSNLIYYITNDNRLIWNRHVGNGDGSFQWAEPENREVGRGWDFKQVFSGGNGLIYYITNDNRLIWNRHVGNGDGSFQWAEPENREVGRGWDFKQVFSG